MPARASAVRRCSGRAQAEPGGCTGEWARVALQTLPFSPRARCPSRPPSLAPAFPRSRRPSLPPSLAPAFPQGRNARRPIYLPARFRERSHARGAPGAKKASRVTYPVPSVSNLGQSSFSELSNFKTSKGNWVSSTCSTCARKDAGRANQRWEPWDRGPGVGLIRRRSKKGLCASDGGRFGATFGGGAAAAPETCRADPRRRGRASGTSPPGRTRAWARATACQILFGTLGSAWSAGRARTRGG